MAGVPTPGSNPVKSGVGTPGSGIYWPTAGILAWFGLATRVSVTVRLLLLRNETMLPRPPLNSVVVVERATRTAAPTRIPTSSAATERAAAEDGRPSLRLFASSRIITEGIPVASSSFVVLLVILSYVVYPLIIMLSIIILVVPCIAVFLTYSFPLVPLFFFYVVLYSLFTVFDYEY